MIIAWKTTSLVLCLSCSRSFQCQLSAPGGPISAVQDGGPRSEGQHSHPALYAFHGAAQHRSLGPLLVGGREFPLHQLVPNPSTQPELGQAQHAGGTHPSLAGWIRRPGTRPAWCWCCRGRALRQPCSTVKATGRLHHRRRPQAGHASGRPPHKPALLQDRDPLQDKQHHTRHLWQTHEKWDNPFIFLFYVHALLLPNTMNQKRIINEDKGWLFKTNQFPLRE